jgi:hypothetical protein
VIFRKGAGFENFWITILDDADENEFSGDDFYFGRSFVRDLSFFKVLGVLVYIAV